jgi:protein gp37
MGDKTKIQWTDATWNVLRGCSRISEGCRNCYAERMAARFSGPGMPYEGVAEMRLLKQVGSGSSSEPRWTGELLFIKEHLSDPFRWKKPRRIFVNSMSDLFHERVSLSWFCQILAVMVNSPQHTFQVLTKRPGRMKHFLESTEAEALMWGRDLGHIWWGVSVEDQETANVRVPLLLSINHGMTPVLWVSYEPALAEVSFRNEWMGTNKLTWIVVGGESGPRARPFNIDWARSVIAQCKLMNVACFVKQFGSNVEWDGIVNPAKGQLWPQGTATMQDTGRGTWRIRLNHHKGGNMDEWPKDLQVREYPQSKEDMPF